MIRLLLAAATLLMLGCGTGGSRKAPEVRIAVTRGSLIYLPLFVAGPAGCFAAQGLDVRVEEMVGAPKSMQALLGGSVDVIGIGYMQTLEVAAKDQPVRAIAVMQNRAGNLLGVSPKARRPVREIRDLKGLNLGVSSPGAETHHTVNYLLARNGLRPEDVSIVSVGAGMSNAAAVEQGLVDVSVSMGITVTYLQRRYPSLQILVDLMTDESSKAALGFEQIAQGVVVAHERWLQSNPETARKVAAATKCALSWIHSHTPREIRGLLPASCLSPDEAADLAALASSQRILSSDGRMTEAMHEAAVTILNGSGQAERVYPKAYTNEFLPP